MIKLFSLFSGIGAFEKALSNMDKPFYLAGYCENNIHAAKSYSIIHNISETRNFGDITQIDPHKLPKDISLITYGFPCQDLSLAGRQKGLLICEKCGKAHKVPHEYAEKRGKEDFFCDCGGKIILTRSGLFFKALDIIKTVQPEVAICENVKALAGKLFQEEFRLILDELEQAGYKNYYKILNAKDFNMPQNRERIFIISIRADKDKGFIFPETVPLSVSPADLLDEVVEDKYYIKNPDKFYYTSKSTEPGKIIIDDTLGFDGPRFYENFIPALRASRSGLKCADKAYLIAASRGRYIADGGTAQHLEVRKDGLLNTITTVHKDNYIINNQGIRRLTPAEYFRFMGFTDKDVNRLIDAGVSDAQLYKQAGNSIVVNVAEAIFTSLFEQYPEFDKD